MQVLAILVGVLGASALVWQTSGAAFTASTDTTGSFSAGTVTLTDDDGGSALFTATGWVPSDTTTGCIEVSYGGSVDPGNPVTLTTASSDTPDGDGNGLSDDLDVTVELGTAGSDCTSFTVGSTLATTTPLSTLTSGGATSTGWTPAPGTDDMRPFRITVTLGDDTANDAQGDSTSGTFTWAVST